MSNSNNPRFFDVLILGGGVSGLSSALHLLKSPSFGGSIGLLEGRDRLGGRIHSTRTALEERKIEMGANWIHGIIGNPVYELLSSRQAVDPLRVGEGGGEQQHHEDDYQRPTWNIQAKALDGKDVNSYWVRKVYEVYSNIMKRSCLFFAGQGVDPPPGDSLGAFLRREADRWIAAEVAGVEEEAVVEVVRGLFQSLYSRETCISGCHSMDEVSLQNIGAYEEFAGGNLTVPKGYYTLIELLLEDISSLCDGSTKPRSFEALKSCKVVKVEWPGTTATTTTADQQQPTKSKEESSTLVTVTCDNGRTFQCAHLIVTLPLGVLKAASEEEEEGKEKHPLFFSPPLPAYKREVIRRMGFGTVDKIFLEYGSRAVLSSRFTREGVHTDEMMLLWGERELAERKWYAKIFSIYRISDHCIQLWVTGREAEELEALAASKEEVNRQLTEQLRRFFADPAFPLADNVILTRWGADPLSRGSYSFISVGSSVEDVKRLALPVYHRPTDAKPVLAFAGEATHPAYFSTVHGAFLSGQAVAKHFILSGGGATTADD